MDAELKAKWVKALRSGEYKQARGILRDNKERFCCLGVLLDIQGFDIMGEYTHASDRESATLPASYSCGLEFKQTNKLAQMNDGSGVQGNDNYEAPKSFSEIADYIEANL